MKAIIQISLFALAAPAFAQIDFTGEWAPAYHEDAVAAHADVAVAKKSYSLRSKLEGDLLLVEDDVVVAEALPLGEPHAPQTLPLRGAVVDTRVRLLAAYVVSLGGVQRPDQPPSPDAASGELEAPPGSGAAR